MNFSFRSLFRPAIILVLALTLHVSGFAATINNGQLPSKKSKTQVKESPRARKHISTLAHSRGRRTTARRRRYYERFYTSSFTKEDVTAGDVTDGEDPVVRQAAIEALGNMNGTVVAIDPTSGRILAMVNQKLALSEGATPCSTIKLSVGLAALSEGLITRNTPVKIAPRRYMTLTE